MTKLKFRVWDIKSRKMYGCVDRIDWLISGEVIRVHCCLSEIETVVLHNGYNGEQGFILMQFIGMNDKNKKEIYEGDVLKTKTPYVDTTTNFVVDDIRDIYYETREGFGEFESREVVGNIYENPELVEA